MADPTPRLADEHAIRTVLLRYCRGVDRIDLELVRACFHPDAVDDHGDRERTVDELLEWIGRLLPRYDVTMHVLANTLVEFHPSLHDVARVESYGIAEHATAGGAPELNLTIFFRYLDRFEQRGDTGWRISDRRCITEMVRANDPGAAFPVDPRYPRGRRGDGSDPVLRAWD